MPTSLLPYANQRTFKAAQRWICPRCSLQWTRRHLTSSCRRLSRDSSMTKPNVAQANIFSLIQPTGVPHLGNYLGALRKWKELQDDNTDGGTNHKLYFGLADLHSLTSKQSSEARLEDIRNTFASLLALGIGLDTSSNVFMQSLVPAHSELFWILSNIASTGYLSRMTQWKDKLGLSNISANQSLESMDTKSRDKLKVGLFTYPVLQAADILLYDTDLVPVGEDQAQHVEFTRYLARAFNSAHGSVFKVPEVMLSPAKRVMSLQIPTKKMSKSDSDVLSRILITDSADDIRQKFKRAKTDSVSGPITYEPETRPGVSNLIEILQHVTKSLKSPEEIAAEVASTSLQALKSLVAQEVISELDGVKESFEEMVQPKNQVFADALDRGLHAAKTQSDIKLEEVKKAVGLLPWSDRPPAPA